MGTSEERNKGGAGKGDKPRHLKSKDLYDKEWDRIFGKPGCKLNHKHDKDCEND